MRDKLSATKDFIERRKVGIAVVSTATIMAVLNRAVLKNHDDFLKEKGLYDEFYTREA